MKVISNDGSGKSVNLAGKGLVLFLYHESILSDTIHASIEYADTGSTFVTDDSKNVRESLPIVGTEKVEVKFEDNSGQISFHHIFFLIVSFHLRETPLIRVLV